jgi:hypothetical protein
LVRAGFGLRKITPELQTDAHAQVLSYFRINQNLHIVRDLAFAWQGLEMERGLQTRNA